VPASRIRGVKGEILRLYNELTQERYVRHRGSILPPRRLRLCDEKFKDDDYFLKTAELEAERLLARLGCTTHSKVLEIGCGAGRLPIGILRKIGEIEYVGLDVLPDRIEWCRKYISGPHPSFQFRHLNVYSERYNTNGKPIDGSFRFDYPSDYFDIVYLYGVVINMTEEHTRIYLRDIRRLVKPTGRVFISASVEENVPKVTVNPPGYLGFEFSGPLNHVLYERNYFRSILEESGLKITEEERMPMEYFEMQTAFYLTKSFGS